MGNGRVDDALMGSSTGPVLCRSRMEPGAAAASLEDVADRALQSEFKPDDGAGASVAAEAVGDQSAQRPVITGRRCDASHDAFSQLAHAAADRGEPAAGAGRAAG